MVEVMFWRADNTAICFGYQSKFQFANMEAAEEFVSHIEIPECTEVSFQKDGEDAMVYCVE